uniref:Small nuclear RNA activating complex polypeptide 2 n=1 Tax=Chrysemys picta bellii TaxID=8478 RepID=A0A8C3F4B2_CHRPI
LLSRYGLERKNLGIRAGVVWGWAALVCLYSTRARVSLIVLYQDGLEARGICRESALSGAVPVSLCALLALCWLASCFSHCGCTEVNGCLIPVYSLKSASQVWTDLAEKLTDKLEETVTAAFSQKLTRAAEKKVLLDSSSQRDASPAPDDAARNGDAAPGPPAAAQSSSTSTDPGVHGEPEKFSVDFEKIYKYLSMLSRDIKVPELSPYESAVVLDLLMSLPEELSNLDYNGLKSHMHRSYRELTAPQPDGSRKESDPGARAGELAADAPSASVVCERPPTANLSVSCTAPAELAQPSDNQERPSRSGECEQGIQETPQPSVSPSSAQHSASHGQLPPPLHSPAADAQKSVWKDLGICPLNLFLVPLELLVRKGDSLD